MTDATRIVIAEDDPILAVSLADQLTRLGYQVVGQARNGQQAVELVKAEQPDLTILDIKMPLMDGIEAARLISEQAPTALIMLTAYGQESLVEQASEVGAWAYLTKPARDGELNRAIRMALTRSAELEEMRRLRAQAEARAAEAGTLRQVAEALNRAVGLEETLENSLAAVMQLIGCEAGWITLLDDDGVYRLAASRGLPPALAEDFRRRQGHCNCQRQLLSGALDHAVNILECERLMEAPQEMRGLKVHATVPLFMDERWLGNLNLASPGAELFTEDQLRLLMAIGHQVSAAVERARLHEKVKAQRVAELESIAEVSGLVTAGGDLQATLETLARKIAEVTAADFVYIGLYDPEKETLISPTIFTARPMRLPQHLVPIRREETSLLQLLLRDKQPILLDGIESDPRLWESDRELAREVGIRTLLVWPLLYGGELIGRLDMGSAQPRRFAPEDLRLLSTLADQIAVTVRNAQLFAETQRRLHELSLLLHLSAALRAEMRVEEILSIILDHTLAGMNADGAALLMIDADKGDVSAQAARGEFAPLVNRAYPMEDMPPDCALRNNGQCFGLEGCPFWPHAGQPLHLTCIVLKVGAQTLGELSVGARRPFGGEDLRLLRGIADMAANALRRASLFEEVRLYKDAFDSTVDSVMITDLQGVILDINPAFERVTGYSRDEAIGETPRILRSRHSSDEFYREMWGRILTEGHWTGELINVRKDGAEWDAFLTISTVRDERGEPVAYVGINRDITETKNLQRELADSYLATIEALAAALDARDRETEGHSRRVALMAVRIAEAMGLSESEREALLHGALLHDVGKIGISDTILLKPGKLTEAEWVEMRKHPQIGYDMLKGVRFLENALPVVLCHHERWDGNGYPQGLQGEQIPLIARIFAVVDVWDALRSERPYRKAWPEEQVSAHIREQAGKHFDPQVVEMFLALQTQSA